VSLKQPDYMSEESDATVINESLLNVVENEDTSEDKKDK